LRALCVLLASDSTAWERARLSKIVQLSHIFSAVPLNARSTPVGRQRQLTRSHGDHPSVVRGPYLGFMTSGTTGHSKLALRTQHAMLVEATAMRCELDLTPARRLAALVPLHHSFGFGDCALAGILAGLEVCSFPKLPPSAYLAAFTRLRTDIVALVPPQLRLLAQASREPIFENLSVISAGAPLDARTARLANERLGCSVGQVYGTTETGVIAVAPPGEGNLSVGAPSYHVDVRLEALPPDWDLISGNVEGVVAVHSEALFEGYLTLDGVDRSPIRNGWFSTGDCARLVDGRLELMGRLTAAMNVAGAKVSPEEVEATLLEFPAVETVLVTGVGDALAHHRIKAFVSPANIDLEALRRFCEERLSASKRPHYYEAVAALATTPSGKVIRKQSIGE